ncbi:signal transduction histidine kinase [Siphonobacter sp. SORGH_AS 1065]|nr:signal transduction histidine kinase [Siphonobacter sp. SORGH_AS_1065]
MNIDNQRWYALSALRHYLSICLICLPALIFFSCQWTSTDRVDHPKQWQAWFDQVDSLARQKGVLYSIHLLDSLMQTLPQPGAGDRIKHLKILRQLYQKDSNYSKQARKATDELLSLFKSPDVQKKYPRDYADALLFKGDDLLQQRRYSEVYPYYFEGKLVLIEAGETCELSKYSRRIAMVSYGDKKYHQAIEYYKKEFEELQNCQPDAGFELTFVEKQGSLDNIGLSYRQLGDLDSALYYYDRALAYIRQEEKNYPNQQQFMSLAKVVVMSNQADAYMAKKDYSRAETMLIACIDTNYRLDSDIENAQLSQLSLIKLYLKNKAYPKVHKELQRLAESLLRYPSREVSFEYQKMSGQYQYEQKNYETAAHHLMTYIGYRDENEREERKGLRLDISRSMAQTERDYEIALNKQRARLQELSLAIILLVTLTILSIAFLVYRNWKNAQRNVAELTLLNEEIARQNTVMIDTVKALEESQQQNQQMMKIVAHDLRNPIGAVHSATQLLLYDGHYTEEQLELLNLIQTASMNATSLISQLLQVNMNANQDIQKEEVQLRELLSSSVNMLRHKADDKQQIISLNTPEVTIRADREKVFRVIGNLLGNAIKFSDVGETIHITVEELPHDVIISVQDRGIGIPESLQKHIFEFFTTAKRAGTSGEQPFGLGLAICRQIVMAHGGQIWFNSIENQGTQFFVKLPKA